MIKEGLKETIKKIFLIEILKGLKLTLSKLLFAKPVTIEYYDKVRTQPFSGFRGRHALVRNELTQEPLCVACFRCVKVCPSKCIYIKVTETEENGKKKRKISQYEIDATRCVYCAYCVEVCPLNALVLTEFYEYVGETREDLYFTQEKLLKNWDEFISKMPRPYFNPFWKPEGIPEKFFPHPKKRAKGV